MRLCARQGHLQSAGLAPRRLENTYQRCSGLGRVGHRIHYDDPYARNVKGYDGLVVHGPFLAQHLMLMGAQQLGRPLIEVSYRATASLVLPNSATLHGCVGRTRHTVWKPLCARGFWKGQNRAESDFPLSGSNATAVAPQGAPFQSRS